MDCMHICILYAMYIPFLGFILLFLSIHHFYTKITPSNYFIIKPHYL